MNDNEMTLFEMLVGGSPSKAIEHQERRGQQDMVANCRLPKQINAVTFGGATYRDIRENGVTKSMSFDERYEVERKNNIAYTKRKLELLGIQIVDEYDDLFYNVMLPDGWVLESSDHPMWNYLYDAEHKEVLSYFYKAAFYDRDAFINFAKGDVE